MDFTDCSQRALHYAVWFAQLHKAKLSLLYVVETNIPGSGLDAARFSALESDLRQTGRKQLAKLRRQEIPAGLVVQSLVRAGRTDAEILRAASALKADLIVMATHSRDSQQGQLGLTAERVARAAACPVLLVPVPEQCVPFFL